MRRPAPLLGGAIGDALGVPFEGKWSLDPVLQAWDGATYLASETHGTQPGWFSDDTQMSVALANTLVDRGTYDPVAAMDAYLAWFQSGKARGMGGTIREAILRYMRSHNVFTCGVPGSQGNGTAMRAHPLGLAFHRDIRKVAQVADLDAALTHQSQEAKHASQAIATGVALLTLGTTPLDQLVKTVALSLPAGRLKVMLETLPYPLGARSMAGAIQRIPRIGVLADVATVFVYATTAPSFHRGVENAIRHGGDTDTLASMTGALLGAHYGLDGIPEFLIRPLESSASLMNLDEQLLAMAATV